MALPYRGLRPSQEDREIKRFIGSQEVQEDQEGRRKRLSSRRCATRGGLTCSAFSYQVGSRQGHGPLAIEVRGDRAGTFDPRLMPKHERRFTGFDAKILALYARGMTVREIQAFLSEMYAVEVSPDLISTVCDSLRGSLQFPLLPDLPELPVI
jgi:transposase-like protein